MQNLRRYSLTLSLTLFSILIAITPSHAQDETPTKITDQNRSGDLPFSGTVGTDVEHVVISSGNLVVNIPFATVPGRGMPFNFAIRYDGRLFVTALRTTPNNHEIWNVDKRPYLTAQGIWAVTQPALSYAHYILSQCYVDVNNPQNGSIEGENSFIYHDATGAKHLLAANWETGQCFYLGGNPWAYASPGPDLTGEGDWTDTTYNTGSVWLADGTRLTGGGVSAAPPVPPDLNTLGGYGTFADTNGNSKGEYAGGTDTLGRVLVTQQNGANYIQYVIRDSSGTSQTYTVNYAPTTLSTSFSVSGGYGSIFEYSGTRQEVTSIVLPNGRSYTFQYDNYGSLTEMILPSGATINYAWTNYSNQDCTYRYVSNRTVVASGQTSTWTFSHAPVGTASCGAYQIGSPVAVTETDPLGNQAVYNVTEGNITLAKFYQGAATGTPLRQYTIDYTNFNSDTTAHLFLPIRITTQLEDGHTSKKEIDYDTLSYTVTSCGGDYVTCDSSGPSTFTYTTSRGNVKEIREYDYGSGSPGSLLRRTTKAYLHDGNTNYIPYNIVSKVITSTIYDSTANTCKSIAQPCARTQYEYDNYVASDNPLQTTTNAPQHDYTGHGSTFTLRGNVTRVNRWRNTDGALLATTYTYDDLGNIRAIKDPLSHTTSYDYTDSFANSACLPPTNSQAYVRQVTNALGQNIQIVRYPCTGLVQAHKDQNDINAGRAGTTYAYDLLGRLLTKNAPDGGQIGNSYNDASPVSVTTTTTISSSLNLVSTAIKDGLSRVTQAQLTSDPQGTIFVDTAYDGVGNASTVSNPYRSTSDPTYGITTTKYDVLGRVTKVIPPDGTDTANNVRTDYSGNSTIVTDQTGKQRRSFTDALGRLIEVDEPGGGTSATSASGSSTVSGAERTIGGAAATAGTGSATITGNEQSKTGAPATSGTGTVTVSGSDQYICDPSVPPCSRIYDYGEVSVTVNGFNVSAGYVQGDTPAIIASDLNSQLNASASPVTSTVSGTTITLTAKTTGAASNYSLSATSSTSDPADFGGASFSASTSGSTLTGGRDALPTIYDSGSAWVTVNGTQYSASYGQNSTSATVTSAIASQLNTSSLVSASASGSAITITARSTGAATNYSLSSGSSTSQPGSFSSPSFSVSVSGATMTGGHDATATIYDSGTVWITLNGTQYSASYDQNGTSVTLASALASQLNASGLVAAAANGSTITLTATSTGAGTNYPLSSGSSTSQPTNFSGPSFTVAVSGLSGGADAAPPSLSTPAVTFYTYDALDNLNCVVQKGPDTSAFSTCAAAPATWRPRSFTYNSLSQLGSATNPESGTISYSYDGAGNLITKTDGRGIVTTFAYEAINRITQKSFSDATPTVKYGYDAIAPPGCTPPALTIANGVGRRTGMCDAAGSEAWSYDINPSIGWKTTDVRTTNGVTRTTILQNNLNGSITTLTYPSGRVVTYAPDSAGRTISAVDTANAINYATNAAYAPHGAIASLQNGASLISTSSFNNRLQPCRVSVKSTGAAPASCTDATTGNVLDYSYNFGLGAADNGNVTSITNNRDNTRSQSFAYDALNRIATAVTQTTTGLNAWGVEFGYDVWGNLLTETVTQGSAPMLSQSVDTNNRIAAYCYDAAGNLLQQGACPGGSPYQYNYNAENQLVSTAGISYVYDGDGKRVQKNSGTLYWYGTGSDPLVETDLSGNLRNEYVFFNGKRIARRDANNNVSYYFADHLGTARVSANSSGAICYDADFYPFGGERIVTDNCDSAYKFTGKERDSESGLDDFDARYYSSSMGRFMSPDWSAAPMGVPYADFGNPQSLNLYSYVKNNPLSNSDPDGHCDPSPGCALQLMQAIQNFADHPGEYVKAFVWGAVKQELSTVRENLDLKPAPELASSNDVERAGAGMQEAAAHTAVLAIAIFDGAGGLGETPSGGSREVPSGGASGKPGEVYVTEPQESGKPYVGRTTQGVDTRMETRTDGRTGKAATVDTYKTTEEGRYKEQKAIDQHGGVNNLDNKRNEVNQKKMQELKKKYE